MKGHFGFWLQTLADLELLDLELSGLCEEYRIDALKKEVSLHRSCGDITRKVAHLERIDSKKTLYSEFVESFGDTNAYAFHNLYPFKGKFYPRLVRTLINAFKLGKGSVILDPFTGSGTTNHEASIMGIKSYGIEITPIGKMIAETKNELLKMNPQKLNITENEIDDVIREIETKRLKPTETINKLLLLTYFDTTDAFNRTTKYNKKGFRKIFIEKLNYIKECGVKLQEIKQKYKLEFEDANIVLGDVLKIRDRDEFEARFDACITSPPYYIAVDYVEKDKVAYEYLGVDTKDIKEKCIGLKGGRRQLEEYFEDLDTTIKNIYWALKNNGLLAIVVGDSTSKGQKLPITQNTIKSLKNAGFQIKKIIHNPLIGIRNRAIRGENIIICQK